MIVDGGGYWRFWAILPICAAGILLPGCSGATDDLPRQPVAGRVFVGGRPIAHGTIMFYPEEVSTKQHERVASGDSIVDGWFSIARNKGLVPGKYSISISSEKQEKRQERIEREASPGKPHPHAEETIPLRFNGKTELEVEIKEGGIKELKIELPAS
jgi:hypothetical protein